MKLPDKYSNIVSLSPGQNAFVYSAINNLTSKPVFLKVYAPDPNDITTALREPYLLASLDHINLARIYSADRISDTSILLEMELISGGSLQSVLDEARRTGNWPTLYEVLEWCCDIASGLGYLHARSYVHRDVKPANVVLRPAHGRLQAVVADLGLAGRIGTDGRCFASKHARLYRPPEVWEGAGYSISSDIYQLGVILLQLFGGEIRYGYSDAPDIVLASMIKSKSIFDMKYLAPHIGKLIQDSIQGCLANENKRYKNAIELVKRLHLCKKENHDWKYKKSISEFELVRTLPGGREYCVRVVSVGSMHRISRSTRSKDGVCRKQKDEIVLKHRDLRRCREFSNILEDSAL